MYAAASLATKRTTSATSAALTNRPAGIGRQVGLLQVLASAAVMSVSMKPGATTLAVMPRPRARA